MAFREIKIEELQFNPITKIGKEWLLITAGDEKKHNTMTASWGGVGVLWGKNVVRRKSHETAVDLIRKKHTSSDYSMISEEGLKREPILNIS